jgi:chemotaxis protein CheC
MSVNDFSSFQLDALREISNIGVGNAVTSLSQILNQKVDITIPNVNIISFDDMFTKVSSEEVVAGVVVRMLGDTPGNILFIFETESAQNLIKVLVGQTQEITSDMGSSVLCEIGNIISASYMNAIAKFTNLSMIASVPAMAYDMEGAILSTIFMESGQYDDYILDIETGFLNDESISIKGHFYYVPVPGSLEKILSAIGIN